MHGKLEAETARGTGDVRGDGLVIKVHGSKLRGRRQIFVQYFVVNKSHIFRDRIRFFSEIYFSAKRRLK